MNHQLAALLSSPKEDDLLKALHHLVKNPDPEALPLLERILGHADPQVAGLALNTALLVARESLLKRSPGLAKAARETAIQLIRTNAPEFVRALIAQMDSLDSAAAVNAFMAARHFLDADRAADVMRRYAKAPEPRIRATLVRHVGPMAGPRSPELISRFLEDSDPRVRANAIETIEQMGNRFHVRVLSRFRSDTVPRIRANTAKALFALGDRSYFKILEDMVASIDRRPIQLSAVWVIGEIGRLSRDTLLLLRPLAGDPSPEMRDHLRRVVEKSGPLPEIDFLRGALKEDIKAKLRSQISTGVDLSIATEPRDKYTLLKLTGSLTVETLLKLKFVFQDLDKARVRDVVLAMNDVIYMDSSALALLVNVAKVNEKKGGFLFMAGVTDRIRELVEVTGLEYTLKIFNTLDDVDSFVF